MSPDALTAMEANLRFDGPETLATRVFGRLTAWQNWIFQRPNAVGDKGALKVYGKGEKAAFDGTGCRRCHRPSLRGAQPRSHPRAEGRPLFPWIASP